MVGLPHPEENHLIPTYLHDFNKILNKLNILAPFSPGAKLLTSDAVAMYPNINTDEGIATV